jgi:hypothetical protein
VVVFGLIFGLIGGVISGSNRGGSAVIKHYALRLILWLDEWTPFNFIKFLDHSPRLILVKKVGGGYIFIHRMLLDTSQNWTLSLPTVDVNSRRSQRVALVRRIDFKDFELLKLGINLQSVGMLSARFARRQFCELSIKKADQVNMNAFSFVWLRLLFVVQVFSESGIQPLSSPLPEEHGTRNWGYLVDTSFHDGTLHVIFGPVVLLFVVALLFGWFGWWYRFSNLRWTTWEPVEANLKIAEIGDVKIAPN